MIFVTAAYWFLVYLSVTSALAPLSRETRPSSPTKLFSSAYATPIELSNSLLSTLKKPSKTLGVVLEVSTPKSTDNYLSTLSMQLRKGKASALITSNAAVAAVLAQEQATSTGSFPGPCPVIYTGSTVEIPAGVTAIVVDAQTDDMPSTNDDVDVLRRVTSLEDLAALSGKGQNAALWIDSNDPTAILQQLSSDWAPLLVVVAVPSMQANNAEIHTPKEWSKRFPLMNAVAIQNACVGDAEDLEYASFLVDGLTKKKSSTFNMSGLTGSTNGHFGGVASSRPVTWKRQNRQA